LWGWGGGYKSRTPAEKTCAETPENGMRTTRTSVPAVQTVSDLIVTEVQAR